MFERRIMRAVINRLQAWLKATIHRMQAEYCGWCDGWGRQFSGLTPEHKGEATCLPCKGTGRVVEQ